MEPNGALNVVKYDMDLQTYRNLKQGKQNIDAEKLLHILQILNLHQGKSREISDEKRAPSALHKEMTELMLRENKAAHQATIKKRYTRRTRARGSVLVEGSTLPLHKSRDKSKFASEGNAQNADAGNSAAKAMVVQIPTPELPSVHRQFLQINGISRRQGELDESRDRVPDSFPLVVKRGCQMADDSESSALFVRSRTITGNALRDKKLISQSLPTLPESGPLERGHTQGVFSESWSGKRFENSYRNQVPKSIEELRKISKELAINMEEECTKPAYVKNTVENTNQDLVNTSSEVNRLPTIGKLPNKTRSLGCLSSACADPQMIPWDTNIRRPKLPTVIQGFISTNELARNIERLRYKKNKVLMNDSALLTVTNKKASRVRQSYKLPNNLKSKFSISLPNLN